MKVAKQFTLRKEERLKSRKQTELLFSEGKKFTMTPFRIHYTLDNAEKSSMQFGAGVSKKNFKKAVDRNRIKRLMREAYRLQKKIVKEQLDEKKYQLTLFIIYTGKELPVYHDVYEKTGKVLDKLCTIIVEKN
jgi:ribonuclease P protein component